MAYDFDYRIEYANLPYRVKAFVSLEDDFYNIFVNLRHSYYEQQKAIKHELEHIRKRDFQKDCVSDIEFDME